LLAAIDRASIVAGSIALGSEVDVLPLLRLARDRGRATALPVTAGRDQPIRFASWSLGDPLVAGPFGLRQPADHAPSVTPDLILTPLLGFDRALNRLGQGAGHYDRAFAACPDAVRIGVAWSVQEVDRLVADPWDVPLHAIMTEREWIEGR